MPIYAEIAAFPVPERRKCSYYKQYTDVGSKESLQYSCSRPALLNEHYCELHSKDLWKLKPNAVIDALESEIKRARDAKIPVLLIGCHLPDTNLSRQNFCQQVYFQNAVFHGSANFKNSRFEEIVSFRECVFEGLTSFQQARFAKDADFAGMTVKHHVIFSYARFSALAQLTLCAIQKGDFKYTIFSEALIRESEFAEYADFSYADFNVLCDLFKSVFRKGASFRDAQFSAAAISNVDFQEKSDFGQITFKHPERVHFNSNLSKVSFIRTDLFRVRFDSDTVWNNASPRPRSRNSAVNWFRVRILRNSETISLPYDVRELIAGAEDEAKAGKMRLADALSVLRDLRDNYEYRLDYESAGKFFVQEMDLRRKYKDVGGYIKHRSWCQRWLSPIGCYRWLCMYGESLYFPTGWMALVFVLSVVFFHTDVAFENVGTCKLAKSENVDTYKLVDYDKLWYALTRTLSGLLQWGCHALPDYVLRAASIPILGTLFVALRRRFERRFRH